MVSRFAEVLQVSRFCKDPGCGIGGRYSTDPLHLHAVSVHVTGEGEGVKFFEHADGRQQSPSCGVPPGPAGQLLQSVVDCFSQALCVVTSVEESPECRPVCGRGSGFNSAYRQPQWSLFPVFSGCLEEHHSGHSDLLKRDDTLSSRLRDSYMSLGALHALPQSQLSEYCLEALLGDAAVSELTSRYCHWSPLHGQRLGLLSLSLRLWSPLLVHGINPVLLLGRHLYRSLWELLAMNASCRLLLLQDWAELLPMSASRVSARRRAMRQRILGSHTPPCHRRMVITT